MKDRTFREENAKNTNQSSGRLLELIEFMAGQTEPMRISDISAGCGLHPSTAHRFLSALLSRGYAIQDAETGRYSLTFKLCRLGEDIRQHTDLRSLSRSYLRELSHAFGETVSFAIEYDMAVMYLEVLMGPLISLRGGQQDNNGDIAPLHGTAAGKLFLLGYNARQLEQFLAIKGMPACTPHTLTTLQQLRKELLKVRIRGYAYDNEEVQLNSRGVAAPVKNYANQVVAAICVQGPVGLMTDAYIQQHLPLLLECAGQISSRLGYESSRDFLPNFRR